MSEKEYISRESALGAIIWNVSEINNRAQAESVLRDVPVADVVKVVRCKDCAEWQRGWDPVSTQKGAHFCAITGLFTDPGWFCKDGNISEVSDD